jgi:hypothetical protein
MHTRTHTKRERERDDERDIERLIEMVEDDNCRIVVGEFEMYHRVGGEDDELAVTAWFAVQGSDADNFISDSKILHLGAREKKNDVFYLFPKRGSSLLSPHPSISNFPSLLPSSPFLSLFLPLPLSSSLSFYACAIYLWTDLRDNTAHFVADNAGQIDKLRQLPLPHLPVSKRARVRVCVNVWLNVFAPQNPIKIKKDAW